MTDDELIEALRKLSEKIGLSMTELYEIARTIAQADIDPLPPDQWGKVFDNWHRVPVFENDDFCTLLDPVPEPNAQVDLRRALHESAEDLRNSEYALTLVLPFGKAWLIFKNSWEWCRFWAARWPRAEGRAKFEAELGNYETDAASVVAKINAILRRGPRPEDA